MPADGRRRARPQDPRLLRGRPVRGDIRLGAGSPAHPGRRSARPKPRRFEAGGRPPFGFSRASGRSGAATAPRASGARASRRARCIQPGLCVPRFSADQRGLGQLCSVNLPSLAGGHAPEISGMTSERPRPVRPFRSTGSRRASLRRLSRCVRKACAHKSRMRPRGNH